MPTWSASVRSPDNAMRRAFITGITGQTGSYLSEHLVEAGWEVHGLVRNPDLLEAEYQRDHPLVTLHHGDLYAESSLVDVLEGVRPDVIFNLGGLSSVGASWANPDQVAIINGVRVGSVLDHALQRTKEGDPVTVVQASSAEIFGDSAEVPQNESTPIRPVNPYGAAKALGHHLVGVYRRAGVAATSAILYNHESPRRPPHFVTRKITLGAARVSLGLDQFITLGNLDVERDWGWAPDYARALALAADGQAGDYVVATGIVHTVRDFVRMAFEAAGVADWESRVKQDPAFMRAQDASVQQGDATRAREVLGWQPTVALDEIVRRMVENDIAQLRAGL
jgi:GDPmannose 4,6-dehydratase